MLAAKLDSKEYVAKMLWSDRLRKAPLITLLFLSYSLPSDAQPFQLGVDETHVVPQSLQEGSIFNESNLPEEHINGWYRIPRWFAGTTMRSKITLFLGLSGKSVRYRTRGKQLDANGRIWEARCEPVRYDIERKSDILHTVLTEEEPIQIHRDRVVMRYRGLMIAERKRDGRITRTLQTEQIHTFVPNSDGSIKARIWPAKYYKASGAHDFDAVLVATYIENRTAEFKIIDRDDKFNYRQNFVKFLTSSGQSELIPRDNQAEVAEIDDDRQRTKHKKVKTFDEVFDEIEANDAFSR